ncbi:MAG: hypothetical protein RQ736_01905 [Thiogranum sp.]|nr:hypothetical protein [Thiogranum sp.]
MDINRLPVVYLGRPVPTTTRSNPVPSADDGMPRSRVEVVAARPRSGERFDNVVQGELLQRDRGAYQSTRAFIDERNVNHARAAGEGASGAGQQARFALSQYADHVRPEARSDLTQGVSVNYFV